MRRLAAAALAVIAAMPAAAAGDLEEALRSRWLGAWVVTHIEAYSNCDSGYANNEVAGTRVTSRAGLGLAAGELARVDKLNVKGSRVDVYLAIAEPLRLAIQDGPFTLFEHRTCKVQLLVDVAGKDIRAGKLDPIEAAITQVLERFATRAEAEASPGWNGRKAEPLPDDYHETLARHAAWKAEQLNARLAEARERALDEAGRAVERVEDDPAYLAGFATGVEVQRSRLAPSCESIATADFAASERQPPKEHRGEAAEHRSWRRGFRDGQLLAWHLLLARAAARCFLPPPPVPPAR